MPKILLINPPAPAFIIDRNRSIPVGLLYLASNLLKFGHQIKIIDTNNDCLSLEEAGREPDIEQYLVSWLPKEIDGYGPDLVGVGCPFSCRFNTALRISKLIKERFPLLPVVFGGIHPTIYAREILLNCPSIDYVVLGEGEKSFTELIRAYFQSRGEINLVDGVAFREGREVVVNEKKDYIQDLDLLSFPPYELIDLKIYYFDTSGWQNPKQLPIDIPIPLITSRSCPNRCNFCSMFLVHGKKFRARSPKNVVDEIEYIYKSYDKRYFSIMDDNFTLLKDRAIEIASEIIKRKLDIQFDAPNGLSINNMDKDVLDALVQAGLIRFSVGVESGNDYIRNKVIGKHLSMEKILHFNELIKDYKDLFIKAFFIIGFPEETIESLQDTYQLLETMNVDKVGIFYATPYPGTKLFKRCVEEERLVVDWHSLWSLEDFDFDEVDSPHIQPDALAIEYLIEFRKKAYDMFERRVNPPRLIQSPRRI